MINAGSMVMSDAMVTAERMSVLAIDVGTGTQDILLYENGRSIENCEKMVMPSKTMMVAKEVGRVTAAGHDIILTGSTMGGGPSTMAIRRHINAGFKVYATPAAAKTIHDDLNKVQGMGVRIVDGGESADEYKDAVEIKMRDVDISAIGHALSMFDVEVPQHIAVAVQDHGESLEGNRICRFKHLKKAIDTGGGIGVFTYPAGRIPSYLTRMQAVAHDLVGYDVTLMDTGAAAIFGAILDTEVAKNKQPQQPHRPKIVVNIGNGHTLGAIVENGCITACFEHHTSSMTGEKIMDYVKKMIDGTLGFDEVYDDGGHGCYIKEVPSEVADIVVTGPRRAMMANNGMDRGIGDIGEIHFAAPYGDMMLTGCFGLLRGCGVEI